MSNRIDPVEITAEMKRFRIKDNSIIANPNQKSNIDISLQFKKELLENLIKGNPNINDIKKIINCKINDSQFVIDFLKNKIAYCSELLEKYEKV